MTVRYWQVYKLPKARFYPDTPIDKLATIEVVTVAEYLVLCGACNWRAWGEVGAVLTHRCWRDGQDESYKVPPP